MSESQSPQPNVEALIDELRRRVDVLGGSVRLREAELTQRVRDRMAEVLSTEEVEPEVERVVQSLRRASSRTVGQVRFYDVGTVQRIGNGVATISGLPRAHTDELVAFPTGAQGMILNLDHALIDVIMLGSDEGIQGGDLVTATGKQARVPVGPHLLGRIVNPLGQPLDGRGVIDAEEYRYLEREAPDIIERAPVEEPLHTGLKVVDALIPIGCGQRELILGDRQTGKTTLAVDALINQRDSHVSCVYVAIGQKKSSVAGVVNALRRHGVLPKTAVVVSSPDDPPALRYLAPFAGCTIAEFLIDQGRDVLIVYDDLSKHADSYRELSLLLRRPPGREAYPGDIFYLHARLLERACKLNDALGAGSLTALPIVETQRGNISAYIPTNLISICDGQIVLDSEMFNRGIKPAVNVGQSVSRVGGKAQTEAMRQVASMLKLELAQYEEVARFTRFGTQVDEVTRQQIRRGERLQAALRQASHRPLSLGAQIAILLAVSEGILDVVEVRDISAFEQGLLRHVRTKNPELLPQIDRARKLADWSRVELMEVLNEYRTMWLEERKSYG
jgi:F-type H+-transporting ATPase subunit alpha